MGLLTCNDERGEQISEVCKIASLRVPEDIAILGIDNDELICAFSDPTLSSIPLGANQAGYEAAGLLDKLMAGKEKMAGQIIFDQPRDVVARRSTEIIAVKDPEIAESILYIRRHSMLPIQVSKVADHVAMSRRSLERRFRRALGRSVLNEITNVRVDRICLMLTETNRPVSEIALSLGFSCPEHFARYLKRNKGMTPLAYRKCYGPK